MWNFYTGFQNLVEPKPDTKFQGTVLLCCEVISGYFFKKAQNQPWQV